MEKVEGGCLCGAVRFSFTLPTLWCAHCHCSLCRRAHGAPFVTFVGVPREGFQLVAGEADLARYHSTPDATRGFSRRCGSMMLFESTRWADQVHIARAAIPGEIDRAPQAHCFYSDKAAWVTVGDGLPLRGGKTGTEPL